MIQVEDYKPEDETASYMQESQKLNLVCNKEWFGVDHSCSQCKPHTIMLPQTYQNPWSKMKPQQTSKLDSNQRIKTRKPIATVILLLVPFSLLLGGTKCIKANNLHILWLILMCLCIFQPLDIGDYFFSNGIPILFIECHSGAKCLFAT
ncbi:uncharacterized protein LOC134764606 [Penaeus indicus]|uniref:uncharacterized protein LOC134764606 n=1 Tax=Penaeus indicus TaxID=29960 RepID=UPI00300C24C4